MPLITLDVIEYRIPGKLPPVCIVCGQDAQYHPETSFSTRPIWILSLILLGVIGLVVWIILAFALRKACVLHLPLCDEHQGYWRTRKFISGLLMAIPFGCALSALTAVGVIERSVPNFRANYGSIVLIVFGVVILFFFIAWAVYNTMGIQAKSISQFSITLKNVHQSFIAEMVARRTKSGHDLQTGAPLAEAHETDN
jgi:hypothetical protein